MYDGLLVMVLGLAGGEKERSQRCTSTPDSYLCWWLWTTEPVAFGGPLGVNVGLELHCSRVTLRDVAFSGQSKLDQAEWILWFRGVDNARTRGTRQLSVE